MSTDKILAEMLEVLEDIRAILLLTNNSKIDEAKKEVLRDGSEQSKVYKLCDGKTTEEIAQKLGKSEDYVRSNLSRLRQKGLIKTVEKSGKTIHDQRF